ncbi:MAG: polymer-forming cytoskeletal protein [Clostridia bacterium]|jgi:cytoskeletal protein CcmA (bactofilin family)
MSREKKLDVLLGTMCTFKGDIETKGSVTIEGKIEGNILADGDIVFTRTSVAKGEFKGANIILSGQAEGILKADNYIKFSSTAVFIGDTYAISLISDEGAQFTGKSFMLKTAKESK